MSISAKMIFLGFLVTTNFTYPVVNLKTNMPHTKTIKLNRNDLDYSENKASDTFIFKLLSSCPQYFDAIMKNKEESGLQIIYTQIDRGKKGEIKFTDHTFNLNAERYFYPASTVKFPVAILALQKLNELKVPELNKYSTMITGAAGHTQTEVLNDPSSEDGRPSIAHYIKKILLVSDNDAYNRLYEFLGQEYINNTLHKMGYSDAQILHRLQISLTEDENRTTNPVQFYTNDTAKDASARLIFDKPAEKSKLKYTTRKTLLGKGYYKGDELINEPFDFSKKNRLSLNDLHSILKSVLFPQAVPAEKRFNLTKEDLGFLRKHMSMLPGESKFPFYDTAEYWDSYVKFLLYGSEKGKAEEGIRIFNKVGDAYGFLIDAAYVVDFKNNVEFMLSAVIHCNSDGVFNDDQYDYETIGLPFMKNLGRVFYEYELKRKKKHKPVLTPFQFNYQD
jgi:hypothetical protein